MANMIYAATYGYDNSTRATLPFFMAKGAVDGGHQADIILIGDATALIQATVATDVKALGFPPLTELMAYLKEKGSKIYICGGCAKARGMTDADLQAADGEVVNSVDVANLMAAADKVINF